MRIADCRYFFLNLVISGFLALASLVHAQPPEFAFTDEQSKTAVDIIDKLSTRHYRNQPFNDELSAMMLDKFILSLDPGKIFFLQSDIDTFQQYIHKLDDTLTKGDLTPGHAIFTTYSRRAHTRLSWVVGQLKREDLTFDFSKDEYLSIGEDSQSWAQDEQDAINKWRKRLKSNVLSLKLADESVEKAKETLRRRYKNQLVRLEQQDSDDVFEALINALTLLYDPHTSYLSPRTLENFNISMSLSLEGIGAVLQTEDEFTKVVRLISAGPADKQGGLRPADKILSVGQGDNNEMVDVIGWRLDEVVKLIRGPKNTVVRLSVVPADAADNSIRKLIRINRGKVKLEEQSAKKGIIELTDGDSVFKLGVINVPAFYIDFEAYRRRDPEFKSTTRDVYRLLKELKEENVDGMILDLRNNGGGSLQEATTLTDLFIDQGPVVQIRQTSKTISRNYRSRARAVYRGPLVVLTNRLSASASEIFAGAIQDYQRGLIVGAQSFGKGTVQSLTPVHTGQLKITESKFYRVSGDSTQHRGVLPDVAFPFLVDEKEVGESSYDTALPWDQIHPVPHESYYNFKSIIGEINAKHKARIAADPDFIYLNKQADNLRLSRDKNRLSLNEKQRQHEQKDLEQKALSIENERRKIKGLEVFVSSDAWGKDRSAAADPTKAISKDLNTNDDAFLAEAGYILIDTINLLEKQPPDQVANF